MAASSALPVLAKLKEVVLGGTFKTDKIVGRVPQPENLSPWEPLQVRQNGNGRFPMMAYPGQRMENQTKMFPPELFQQAISMPAGAPHVSF